ncbi:MAG: LamG domain-containing protein, partial [Sedimentisphaerales bacterium]|nr:LamG domain-containing protein [Sedimentisphaerales bacterium]
MCNPLRDVLRRKLAYSISFLLILCLLLTSATNAADPTLAGWWNFNEGSGSLAQDSSNNKNDGALENGTNWVAGKIGGGLQFDGTDDQVDCGNGDSLNITGPITIAAWVQPTGPGDSSYPRVVDKSSGTGGADAGYKLYLRSAENYLVTLSAGGTFPNSTMMVELDTWNYLAFITDGTQRKLFLNGEWQVWDDASLPVETSNPLYIGNGPAGARPFEGLLDEVRVYDRALAETEVEEIMLGIGGGWPYASNPIPDDGTLYEDTWVTLNWTEGDSAVSHDVYLGVTFDEVSEATPDSDVYRGNQETTFYVAGFPGFAYPDGLIPGTTYYWRIDEVNDADPNSPWKGDVWSFSIPANKAHNPVPSDGADSVALNVILSWTMGFGAKMHTIYFGEDYDTVANATVGLPVGTTSYNPGLLKAAKSYYWRVDEFDGFGTHKGDVWSFTTEGGISNPYPADGAVEITQTPILTWDPGVPAASHQVYFGTDESAVRSATTASPEYKGTKALGDEAYEPGQLAWETTYYWRIDEVNNVNADSPWKG